MKRLGVLLLSLDGMLVHRRSLPSNLLGFPNYSPVPIYTLGWREVLWELSVLPKNTTQCPRPGLEPGPFDPRTSAQTMRPPRLYYRKYRSFDINILFTVQFLRKLFAIGFSLFTNIVISKVCCLLFKMASKTVTGLILSLSLRSEDSHNLKIFQVIWRI